MIVSAMADTCLKRSYVGRCNGSLETKRNRTEHKPPGRFGDFLLVVCLILVYHFIDLEGITLCTMSRQYYNRLM